MAPEWELGMGNGNNSTTPSNLYGLPSADTLRIDDLLDFSNHELFPSAADGNQILNQPSNASSAAGRDSGSSSDLYHQSFADNIYVPSEEAAELEWLSKFVEDSFSDIPYPSAASIPANHISVSNAQIGADSSSSPSRGARSKRSRAPATAANWSSPPQAVLPVAQSSSSSTSSSSSSDFPHSARKRSSGAESGIGVDESGVRRCTHCASEKTPQWRTGPLGPKTLCNACGVRFKSGRLVPEYRPASSPTFVLTQHSNSHRKVMELRRQKEVHHHHRHQHQHHRQQQQQQQHSQQQQQLIYHDRVMSLS